MVTAIVLAAGVGSRMKSEKAKQFLEVAGHEVLYYSLRAFDEHPGVDSIVLVTKEEFVEHCQKELAERYQFAKVRDICITFPNGTLVSVKKGCAKSVMALMKLYEKEDAGCLD